MRESCVRVGLARCVLQVSESASAGSPHGRPRIWSKTGQGNVSRTGEAAGAGGSDAGVTAAAGTGGTGASEGGSRGDSTSRGLLDALGAIARA